MQPAHLSCRSVWNSVLFALGAVLILAPRTQSAEKPGADPQSQYEAYQKVIAKTAGMVGDAEVCRRARAYGLDVLNVTWEDTGRWKGSAVGPNISDMTIQVQQTDPRTNQTSLTCMPVIRFPNFSDKTADIPPDQFQVLVGNEKGKGLQKISLTQYLGNLRLYLNNPQSWMGDQTYLLAERDTHVLVSAQACFLPVPKQGKAEFNPVLFNYQSQPGDPAVLAILVTREGTSATVIENGKDSVNTGWGQRIFFNQNGQRTSLTGTRISDFLGEKPTNPSTPHPPAEAAGQVGLNVVMLIQVPLETKPQERCLPDLTNTDQGLQLNYAVDRLSDVEAAVIGHGKVEGPYAEVNNLPIKRDARFPIRVTVQFYKATSNGVVSDADMAAIKDQINQVYARGDYVGSLVVEGKTNRPTEHEVPAVQLPQFWNAFWAKHQAQTGLSREVVVAEIRVNKGVDWVPLTEQVLADQAAQPGFAERALARLGSARGFRVADVAILAILVVGGLFVLRFRSRRKVAPA